MITLYGYEEYRLKFISGNFFDVSWGRFYTNTPGNGSLNDVFRIPEQTKTWRTLLRYRGGAGDAALKQLPEFQEKIVVPQDGQTLYFDKSCKIPRIKAEAKWKRTIQLVKADVAVVPLPTYMEYENMAIFLDEASKTIYAMTSNNIKNCVIMTGTTLREIFDICHNNNTLSDEWQKPEVKSQVLAALPAVCIYCGMVARYSPNQEYMIKVIDGVYPRICFEDTLLQLLGTEEEKVDLKFLENITDLLKSNDKESVHQGMRILASVDYAHYPSVVKYVLQTTRTRWERHKPFNSSVQFMLKHLGYSRYGWSDPFRHVTPEEFSLAKDIIIGLMENELNYVLTNWKKSTNLIVDYHATLDLLLPPSAEPAPAPEDPDEETPEPIECPDCPQPEELDFSFVNNT